MKPLSKTMQGSICGLSITQHRWSFQFFLSFNPESMRVPGLGFLCSKQLYTVKLAKILHYCSLPMQYCGFLQKQLGSNKNLDGRNEKILEELTGIQLQTV